MPKRSGHSRRAAYAAKLGVPLQTAVKTDERRRLHRSSVGHCQRCGTTELAALTTHHIEPVESGGPDAPCNWCVLCRNCHDEWHRHEAELRAILARQRFATWLRRGQRRPAFPRLEER